MWLISRIGVALGDQPPFGVPAKAWRKLRSFGSLAVGQPTVATRFMLDAAVQRILVFFQYVLLSLSASLEVYFSELQ